MKYPSEPVVGLLLSNEDSGTTIHDIAPLFHTDLVASTLEIGLSLVSELCYDKSLKVSSKDHRWRGMKIVGCYVANRLSTSKSVNGVMAKFGHAIRKAYPTSNSLLVVDNETGSLRSFSCSKDGSWNVTGSGVVKLADGSKKALSEALNNGATVNDVDDHLDDVECEL